MLNRKYLVLTSALFTIFSLFSCQPNEKLEIIEFTTPVTTHNQLIDEFLSNPVDENIKAEGLAEYSKPTPIRLSWKGSSNEYKVSISENIDMSNPFTITTKNKYYDLYNIKLNTQYYWMVETNNEKSKISKFISKEDKVRLINIDGVTNCRDLGTYKTSQGKQIKQGLIYRTYRFNKTRAETLTKEITPLGEDTLKNQLGVKTEIDLRQDAYNRGGAYDGYIPGVKYKYYEMEWKVNNILLDNKANIKKLFDEVLSKEESYPLAFHCSQGTDRAGCIAYTILALCGVDKKDLIGDYLLSNYSTINIDASTVEVRKFAKIASTYPTTLESGEGTSLMEKAANALVNECNISLETINKVRNILIN